MRIPSQFPTSHPQFMGSNRFGAAAAGRRAIG